MRIFGFMKQKPVDIPAPAVELDEWGWPVGTFAPDHKCCHCGKPGGWLLPDPALEAKGEVLRKFYHENCHWEASQSV